MPETDTTTETAETGDTTPEETQVTNSHDLGDGGKNAIAAEREARKQAEKRAAAAEKAVKEYADRDKTELEKAVERAAEAEKRAAAAESQALRSNIAAAKGVPASSLTGTTEEELTASADALIAWRDQQVTPPAPKRSPTSGGGFKSGATGAESNTLTPKAAAAEAVRRFRGGNR